jgi:hypothetical protein
MRRKITLAATFMFAALPAPATTAPLHGAAAERILIYLHPKCAGLCFDEMMDVSANGAVSRRSQPFDGLNGASRSRNLAATRLQIAPDRAAAFLHEMSTVRPRHDDTDDPACSIGNRGGSDWDILWSGGGENVHLRTCDPDGSVERAWDSALRAIGMNGGI